MFFPKGMKVQYRQTDFKESSYSTSFKQILIVPGTGCLFAVLKICGIIEKENKIDCFNKCLLYAHYSRHFAKKSEKEGTRINTSDLWLQPLSRSNRIGDLNMYVSISKTD